MRRFFSRRWLTNVMMMKASPPDITTWQIYIPRTQMTLVLNGKGLALGGLTFKNRGHWGSRYIKPCNYWDKLPISTRFWGFLNHQHNFGYERNTLKIQWPSQAHSLDFFHETLSGASRASRVFTGGKFWLCDMDLSGPRQDSKPHGFGSRSVRDKRITLPISWETMGECGERLIIWRLEPKKTSRILPNFVLTSLLVIILALIGALLSKRGKMSMPNRRCSITPTLEKWFNLMLVSFNWVETTELRTIVEESFDLISLSSSLSYFLEDSIW